ncbi:MAG: NADH-quinone oxidoreductase subunit NuoE [Calditrichia bacterium]
MLSEAEIKEIEEELKLFPTRRAACIEALKVVQRHRRWVSDEGVQDIARFLEMTAEEVDSVATFYNLVFRRPVGRHVILICDSISCWVMGYEKILAHLRERLGIGLGDTTADDRFTLLPIPCLGTCDHAPALMIDNDLHRDLTPEKLDEIIARYE